MEARKWSVAAAGRVIMDAVQAEWEPLSHWELDQRLDRAVEEMIEADLVAQVQEQTASVTKQASQQGDSSPAESRNAQESALQRAHVTEAMEANPTVQVRLLAHALHVYIFKGFIFSLYMVVLNQGASIWLKY